MSIFSTKKDKIHKETRKYSSYTREKRQSLETNPEEAQMLDLPDEDFKSETVDTFKERKETMYK